MKQLIAIIGFFAFTITMHSQEEKKQFIHKGLLRATTTIAPGILLKENASAIYLHGVLEYYVADNISVRGDGFYTLNIQQPNWQNLSYTKNYPYLNSNHQLFSGFGFHPKTKNNFDSYCFFEPGISFANAHIYHSLSSANYGFINGYTSNHPSVNPLVSFGLGFNYYFQKWFHLFGEARYITGKHLSGDSDPLSLSELRFSFGLGFNLSVLRHKSPS